MAAAASKARFEAATALRSLQARLAGWDSGFARSTVEYSAADAAVRESARVAATADRVVATPLNLRRSASSFGGLVGCECHEAPARKV